MNIDKSEPPRRAGGSGEISPVSGALASYEQAVPCSDADTKRRLERMVPHAEIRYYPMMGRFIPGQTTAILEFLRRLAGARIHAS